MSPATFSGYGRAWDPPTRSIPISRLVQDWAKAQKEIHPNNPSGISLTFGPLSSFCPGYWIFFLSRGGNNQHACIYTGSGAHITHIQRHRFVLQVQVVGERELSTSLFLLILFPLIYFPDVLIHHRINYLDFLYALKTHLPTVRTVPKQTSGLPSLTLFQCECNTLFSLGAVKKKKQKPKKHNNP